MPVFICFFFGTPLANWRRSQDRFNGRDLGDLMKPGKIQHSWALGLSSLILLGCSSAWAESPKGASLFQRLGVSLPSTLVTLPASVQAQLKNFGFQVNPLNSVKSHGITTQRYQINRNGIEVLGAVAMTHQGPMATDGLLEGNEIPLFDISTEPKLKADQASRIALGIIGNRDLQAEPQLKILPSEKDDGSAQLIYWVSISPTEDQSGRDILLDANQGQLVADLSRDIEIAPTEVLMASDKCQSLDVVSGAPVQLNPENCTLGVRSGIVTPDADETAIRADTNSQAVLKYYWTTHGRDSFDDRGSKLTSIVHVGRAFANAFWSSDRNIMAYGDGDGVVMTDLTKALDVAGHEMTHGVTSQTSQLIYRSESGALNVWCGHRCA
ncbi:hypothetical protein EBZ37_03940 [bacterium]|nr:hypothetical protein [bacterium]